MITIISKSSKSAYPADLCTTSALPTCKGICCGCGVICRASLNILLYKFIALGLQINWGGPVNIDGRAAVQWDLDRLGSKLKGTLRNSAGQQLSAQEGRALGVVQLALLSQRAALLKKTPQGSW